MNKALYVIPIVVLLVISGVLAYGYVNSQSELAARNTKYTALSGELNNTLTNYTMLQSSYQQDQSSLKNYESNIQSLKNELQTNQTQVVLNDAFNHWNYISIENSSLLETQYSNNATLKWIGGPLSGTYTGTGEIVSTWNKFFSLWSAVWFYTPTVPSSIVAGNSSTVSAQVQFVLTSFKTPLEVQYLNISYTLNFYNFNGKWLITNEVWDIVSSGIISYSYNEVSALVKDEILNASFSHWDYIAIENLTLVSSQYSNESTLIWKGGPLSGTYAGLNSINTTWNKFFSFWSAVWFYTVSPPTLSISNGTYFVNAQVQWVLTSFETPLQVNSILTNYTIEFRLIDNKPVIFQETWQIVQAGTVSYTSKEFQSLEVQSILNASYAHWNNIAIENLSLVMSQYIHNSSLEWIGGKLSGNYSNYSDIQNVWTKFFSLWSAVWFYSESPPMISVNTSNGTVTSGTVTADIQFVVQSSSNSSSFSYIDVVYSLDFTDINNSFYITHEVFENVGTGPLSQVTSFS